MMTIPAAGHVLGDRYTLREPIASGGMGDVWRATDDVLHRDVAVKVLRHGPATDEPGFRERFRDEARHSAALHHPNIAAVYDYGEDGAGGLGDRMGSSPTAYLVMELVPGRPLSQVIRRAGPLPAEQVRLLVGQAALALAAAHDAGVVHRDVKPANIIVTPAGEAKLTDFGISRAVGSTGHTLTGEVLGTAEYLSPEQAVGEQATGASDLYALGIIAHELLTGRRPFDAGSPVATALAQVNDPPPPLPESLPRELRAVVEACLAKDPLLRPPSARAVADTLIGRMPLGSLPAPTPSLAPSLTSSDRNVHSPGEASLWESGSLDERGESTLWESGSLDEGSGRAGPATRALPVVEPSRSDERASVGERAQRHTRSAKPRRKWAWLAVPAVAVLLWVAFALGSLIAGDPTTGAVPPTSPAVQTPSGGGTMSSAPTTPTSMPPTETSEAAPTTSPEASHPGKGKGKGKK